MKQVQQSEKELEEHLKEQIGFLITSCGLYDDGNHSEAKRIATCLRILFNETKFSRSLLGQLSLRDINWIDTNDPYDPKNLVSHFGLFSIQFNDPSGRIPWLSPKGTPSGKLKKNNFNDWWLSKILAAVDGTEKISFSRKKLILNVANT